MLVLEALGHLSFLLIALSFILKDILLLRLTSIFASVSAIVFQLTVPDEPMWLIVNWNVVFIAIHSVRITLMMTERLRIRFTEEEKELFGTIFQPFNAVEFMKLMRLASWERVEADSNLVVEGEGQPCVRLIYNGRAEVLAGGAPIAEVGDGNFVGEMSFSAQDKASATVRTKTECRVVSWTRTDLETLLRRNPSMRLLTQQVFAMDMVKKLKRPA